MSKHSLLEWKHLTSEHKWNSGDPDSDKKLHDQKQSQRHIIVVVNRFNSRGVCFTQCSIASRCDHHSSSRSSSFERCTPKWNECESIDAY